VRSLRELEQLVRRTEPGTNNIGTFIAARSGELSLLLGVPEPALRASEHLDDGLLARELDRLLRQRGDGSRQRRLAVTAEHTASAAYRIARSATWTDDFIELDDRLLLGDLLVDSTKKFICFYFDLAAVTVVRLKLKEIGRVVTCAKYPDRRAFLDQRGLHIRWREARGGLDLISQTIVPADEPSVLDVVLERPPRRAPDSQVDARRPVLVAAGVLI